MYKDYYQMANEPFAMHPRPDNYFASESHGQVLNLLLDSAQQYEPYILVTGEYGVGKTLLCLKLLKTFGEKKINTAIVFSPSATYGTLLTSIVSKLGLGTVLKNHKTVSTLEGALFQLFISGRLRKKLYIVIDDLHEFSYTMLDRIKLLANFHANDFYPFCLICFAHPGFIETLENTPKYTSFMQRFRRRLELKPLQKSELKEYIYFQLLQAKAKGRPLFDEQALDIIANTSKRIPRVINNICDRALLRAWELGTDHIDLEISINACTGTKSKVATDNVANNEKIGEPVEKISVTKNQNATVDLKSIALGALHQDQQSNSTARSDKSSRSLMWFAGGTALTILLVLVAILVLLLTKRVNLATDTTTVAEKNPVIIAKHEPENHRETTNSLEELTAARPVHVANSATRNIPSNSSIIEKPFSIELFSSPALGLVNTEWLRLTKRGIGPLLMVQNETGQDNMKWSIGLGSFASEQDALASPWATVFPDATVLNLPYTLLIGVGDTIADLENKRLNLEQNGYYPRLDQLENGSFRLLLSAYSTKEDAIAQKTYLHREGITAEVIKK